MIVQRWQKSKKAYFLASLVVTFFPGSASDWLLAASVGESASRCNVWRRRWALPGCALGRGSAPSALHWAVLWPKHSLGAWMRRHPNYLTAFNVDEDKDSQPAHNQLRLAGVARLASARACTRLGLSATRLTAVSRETLTFLFQSRAMGQLESRRHSWQMHILPVT